MQEQFLPSSTTGARVLTLTTIFPSIIIPLLPFFSLFETYNDKIIMLKVSKILRQREGTDEE